MHARPWTYDISVASTACCQQSADWVRVGLSAMAKFGKVHRAHSMINRVHHGAQFMLHITSRNMSCILIAEHSI